MYGQQSPHSHIPTKSTVDHVFVEGTDANIVQSYIITSERDIFTADHSAVNFL